MSDNTVKIGVDITANTTGAKVAATDLKAVETAATKGAGAAKEHAKEAKGLGESLLDMGRRGNTASETIEGLERASSGGAAGLLGLAKAARGAFETFETGTGIGALVQVLTILASVVLIAKERFGEAKGEINETEGAATALAEKFKVAKSAIELLGEAKLDALKDQLDGIARSGSGAQKVLDQLNEIQKQLATAQQSVELANLAADKSLTPDQRRRQEFEIRERYIVAGQKQEDTVASQRVAIADRQAQESAAAATQADDQREIVASRVEAVRKANEEREARLKALEKEREALGSIPPGGDALGERYDPAQQEQLAHRLELEKEIAEIKERQNIAAANPRGFQDQIALLDRLTSAAKAAREAADNAARARDDLRQSTSLAQPNQAVVRGLEAEARRIAAGVPRPDDRPPVKTEVEGQIEIGGRIYTPREPNATPIPRAQPGIEYTRENGETVRIADSRKTGEEIARATAQALRLHTDELMRGFQETFQSQLQSVRTELQDQIKSTRR